MKLPQLTLLDTNVIQNLQSFGEFIYDHYLSDEIAKRVQRLGSRVQEDLLALQVFMDTVQRSGWPVTVSQYSIREIDATPDPSKRTDLRLWANELAAYSVETGWFRELGGIQYDENRTAVARTLFADGEFDFLPDYGDRLLVVSALVFGCGIFLTMDYRTIWRFRDRVGKFGLDVMRPVELTQAMGIW